MSRALWWINEIDSRLLIVSSWVSKKEGFLPFIISPDELRAQNRELGACESLVRQLQTQVQLYGLDEKEIKSLSYVEGTAKDLRVRLQRLEGETIPGFFEPTINIASTIISGISAIVNIT